MSLPLPAGAGLSHLAWLRLTPALGSGAIKSAGAAEGGSAWTCGPAAHGPVGNHVPAREAQRGAPCLGGGRPVADR